VVVSSPVTATESDTGVKSVRTAIRFKETALMLRQVTAGAALGLILIVLVGCTSPPQTVQVPRGTVLVLALTQPLSTATDTAGSSFTATSVKEVAINGHKIVASGDTFKGIIANMVKPGKDTTAAMTLDFQDALGPDGKPRPIHARPIALEATSDTTVSMPKVIIAEAGSNEKSVMVPATQGNIILPEGTTFSVYIVEPTELPVLTD
jgi:hypothetical protein